MPPPEPRSSTVSPGFSSASAVGLPQPREAAVASAGRPHVSLSAYRLEVMGSHSSREDVDPQHASLDDVTRSAAFAYLSLTMLLMSSSAIAYLLSRHAQELQQ